MKKQPNKDLYDIGESLKLWCQAEGGGVAYEPTWYKLNSTGSFVKHSSKWDQTDGIRSEIVSIEKMTDAKATYKCVIRRYQVNYINYKLVKIVLKGMMGLAVIRYVVIPTLCMRLIFSALFLHKNATCNTKSTNKASHSLNPNLRLNPNMK